MGKLIIKNKSYFLAVLITLLFSGNVLGQWQAELRLTEQSALSAGSYNNATKIALAGDTVHVVWHDERDGNREIYYKRSIDNGATWPASPAEDVRLTNATRQSEFPAIAVSGSNVYVVWQDPRSSANNDIYYIYSGDNGTTWSNDTNLTNLATSQKYLPSPVLPRPMVMCM